MYRNDKETFYQRTDIIKGCQSCHVGKRKLVGEQLYNLKIA